MHVQPRAIEQHTALERDVKCAKCIYTEGVNDLLRKETFGGWKKRS